MNRGRLLLKVSFKVLASLGILLVVCAWWFSVRTKLTPPDTNLIATNYERIQLAPDHYQIGNNWLRRNNYGIWEMYLEGAPYERGVIYGLLAKELINQQEEVFIAQIRNMIPSQSLLKWLKYFINWFNRDIDAYVQPENLAEIYGISQSFSHAFDFIGKPYYRVLNYHAAHDIGHALTDLNMVGCTSFSVVGELSADSTLLIGRNFDFNMGDGFAENKLMLFLKPDEGYAFSSVSWAGFTGVVSGMNEKGLTITLNAAKSDIPYKAKTPISLLAREILQYAQNIDEAVAIARKRETFVSESLLIGSAADNRSVVIEKTPSKLDVYDSEEPLTVCANHYQSTLLGTDPANLENIATSDSDYRFRRMKELIADYGSLKLEDGAAILRDKLGINNEFIGYGNPKSINQLLAHHGILFKPSQRQFWVSSNPYQLGEFVGYDLDTIFSGNARSETITSIIPADPFLATSDYRKFEQFKKIRNALVTHLMTNQPLHLSDDEVTRFVALNPESYQPYQLLGDFYKKKKDLSRAVKYYELALNKELPSLKDEVSIRNKLTECSR